MKNEEYEYFEILRKAKEKESFIKYMIGVLTKFIFIAILALVFITIFFEELEASDKMFWPVQWFDSSVAKVIQWEDTRSAAVASDFMLWSTVATPYLFAYKEKDRFEDRAKTILSVQVMSALISDLVKLRTERTRPNKSDKRSFYSGHTSAAFTSAGLVCMQDHSKHKNYCTVALGMAAMTGYLRIAANWHWFSDVFVGAFVGYSNGRYIPTLIMSF